MAFLNVPAEYANKSTSEIVAHAGGGNSLPLIPNGDYQGLFVTSEFKDNSKGTGQILVLKAIITEGEHRDTELTERLNLVNPNPVAVKIAYETLAKISQAIGLDKVPSDSNVLHNKKMIITVKTEKGNVFKDKDTGEERQGRDYSVISGYKPLPQVGVQSNSAPAAASNTPVWARK